MGREPETVNGNPNETYECPARHQRDIFPHPGSRFTVTSLLLLVLFLSSSPACKRRSSSPPSLEAIDQIDRRSNLPLGAPVSLDLAQIRERGYLVVLAPYNSTTYFVYQGEPATFRSLQTVCGDLRERTVNTSRQ